MKKIATYTVQKKYKKTTNFMFDSFDMPTALIFSRMDPHLLTEAAEDELYAYDNEEGAEDAVFCGYREDVEGATGTFE